MSIYNSYSYSLKERELNFINRLLDKAPTFEYISGYTGSESKVLIRCNKCGSYKTITAQCIRTGHRNIICNSCLNEYKQEQKNIEEHKKKVSNFINEYKRNNKLEINKLFKKFKNNTLYIRHCNKCGTEYIEHTKSNYCSECRKKVGHKHSNKSLDKLYKRDKGICYICGGKCDYEDYIITDTTIVCGNYYPSIDHIIPISKGGTDDWENLKLAHRICNTLKSNIRV